jgi:hypothetical protein
MGLLLSPKYQQEFAGPVTRSLENHIAAEEDALTPLLHLVLHFYSNSADEGSTSIFHGIARTIHAWGKSELNFLATVQEAHKLAPYSVVSSIEYWGARFLCSKDVAVREATKEYLRESVFKPEPITDFPTLDSSRLSQTRKLVQACVPPTVDAYLRNANRARYEQAIDTMLAAEEYLRRIQLAGKARSQSMDDSMRASVSYALSIELAELPRQLGELATMWKRVGDWEPLPGARVSVEPTSDLETDDTDCYEDEGGEGDYGMS